MKTYSAKYNKQKGAAIRLDHRELICFSWIEIYHQEYDLNKRWKETGTWNDNDPDLMNKWDANATYSDMDFLMAAATFLQTPIIEALYIDNYIIRILAIADRKIGKRTLQKIREQREYLHFPDWVKQFYELRLGISNNIERVN